MSDVLVQSDSLAELLTYRELSSRVEHPEHNFDFSSQSCLSEILFIAKVIIAQKYPMNKRDLNKMLIKKKTGQFSFKH